MAIVLRDVCATDFDAVLALNNAAGAGILPIDSQRLRRLFAVARYFRVAELDGHLAGFLIGLTPEADYDSPNFRWFRNQFQQFFYIDRVVVAGAYRRHGIGRVLFADMMSFAELRTPLLTSEVFIRPADDVSQVFFLSQGFEEAGQLDLDQGRRVSLVAKKLISFEFVREQYLEAPTNAAPAQWWHDRLDGTQARRLSA
jgi:uncharacterized protein